MARKIRTLNAEGEDELDALAAGVSWYRQLIVTGGGAVVPTGGWNCVTPCHEVVASSAVEKSGKSTVKFTISALAWSGRDDRRPEWIMLRRGNEQLWPSTPQDKRYGYSRLNIGIMQGYRFGRLVEKREPCPVEFFRSIRY